MTDPSLEATNTWRRWLGRKKEVALRRACPCASFNFSTWVRRNKVLGFVRKNRWIFGGVSVSGLWDGEWRWRRKATPSQEIFSGGILATAVAIVRRMSCALWSLRVTWQLCEVLDTGLTPDGPSKSDVQALARWIFGKGMQRFSRHLGTNLADSQRVQPLRTAQ